MHHRYRRALVRRMLETSIAFAMISPAIVPAKAQAAFFCPEVEMLYAAGSGGGQDPNRALRDEIERGVGSDNFFGRAVMYPARAVVGRSPQVWANGIGSVLRLGDVGAYHDSVVDGKNWLRTKAKQVIKNCGDRTKLVLSGWSQGAQVVADVYKEFEREASLAKQIFGVVLFGDTYFNGDAAGRGSSQGKQRHAASVDGALGKRRGYGQYRNRVRSYCHRRDPVCQGNRNQSRWLAKLSAKLTTGALCFCDHFNYGSSGEANDAGRWLSTRVKAARPAGRPAPRPSPSAPPSPSPSPSPSPPPSPPAGVIARLADYSTNWSVNGRYYLRPNLGFNTWSVVDRQTGHVFTPFTTPWNPDLARIADTGAVVYRTGPQALDLFIPGEPTPRTVYAGAVIDGQQLSPYGGFHISQDGSRVAFLASGGGAGADRRVVLYVYGVATDTLSIIGQWSGSSPTGSLIPMHLFWLSADGTSAYLSYCRITTPDALDRAAICEHDFGVSPGLAAGPGHISVDSPYSPTLIGVPGDASDGSLWSVVPSVSADGNLVVLLQYDFRDFSQRMYVYRPLSGVSPFPPTGGQACLIPQWQYGGDVYYEGAVDATGAYVLCHVPRSSNSSQLYIVNVTTGAAKLIDDEVDFSRMLWVASSGTNATYIADGGTYSWTGSAP